jgi:hypothetical protein
MAVRIDNPHRYPSFASLAHGAILVFTFLPSSQLARHNIKPIGDRKLA